MSNKISRIVLTGGPCGGKTTGLAYIRQKLEEKGFIVFIVPEAATLCINAGISPFNPSLTPFTIQNAIIRTAKHLEDTWIASAQTVKNEKGIVLIYDRGINDCRSYTEEHVYKQVLNDLNLHLVEARDARYDAVIHLKSVACDKPGSYTLANNTARREDIQQASERDEQIMNSWVGHPHLRVLDNSTDFEGKIKRVHQEVCSVLGIPVPIEREQKFLISFDRNDLPSHAQHIDIEQVYLAISDKEEIRVRKRGQNGYFTYYQTTKRPGLTPDERYEVDRIINSDQYHFGLSLKQSDTDIIFKERTCFLHKDQYMEIDKFNDKNVLPPRTGLLELESTNKNSSIQIPPWIKVIKEVTGEKEYSNAYLSQRLALNKSSA